MQRFLQILAFAALIAGFVFLVLCVIYWFDIRYFLSTLLCFVAVWILWPEQRHRRDKTDGAYDRWSFLELFVELPLSVFLWIVRAIAAFFRGLARFLDF